MSATIVAPADRIEARVAAALAAAGASAASGAAATRAMMHASRLGVDSHGVRLVVHYCRMLRGGRIARDPELVVTRTAPASAMVDGADGLGHYAAYRAIEVACELAREAGVGAVGVRRSSHLGAAGAYALAGAEAGCVAFTTTNSDAMVAPFDGARKFHGTNPLAFAAPVPDQKPWLFDMATSALPMNRVRLYGTLGKALPPNVAAGADGTPVADPADVQMLLPLGGIDFGFKGAGLAGVATILTAVMTGAGIDPDLLPMFSEGDISTPRNLGAFVCALDPDKFVGAGAFGAAMTRYLEALRAAPARTGGTVMAPGDREWAVMAARERDGIPVDAETATFLGLAS